MAALDLSVFAFDSNAVRVLNRDGEPWFVAKDVCEVLAIQWKGAGSTGSLAALDDDEKGVSSIDTPGGVQELAVINESGLYALIIRSRKPEARRFRKWVTSEVLPSIRKTGGYSSVPGNGDVPRIPAHQADRMVAASRCFGALMRASQGARVPLPVAIRRAAAVALRETGIDLLDEMAAHDHVTDLEARGAHRASHVQRGTSAAFGPHATVAEFFADWSAGQIEELPYASGTTAQAFSAYTHWCRLAGYGETARREVFTATLLRTAAASGAYARVKVMRIGARPEANSERVLLLTTPPDEAQGMWATGVVEAFAPRLKAFLATRVTSYA